MRGMTGIARGRARLVVVCVVVVAVGATGWCGWASGAGLSPWFRVGAVSRPGNLGGKRSEVQEITSSPEVVFSMQVGETPVGFFATEPFFALFGGALPEPTAANIQAALEGVYGAGNVVVSGGPAGSAPLIIESVGADADRAVEAVKVNEAVGKVSAKVLSEGRPDGYVAATAENVGDANVHKGRNGPSGPTTSWRG